MSTPLTATGTISTAADTARTRLTAVFDIGGIEHSFTCTIVPSVQTFMSPRATLTYTDINEINGTKRYTGRVGKYDIVLDLGNGTTIMGAFDTAINSANTVVGTGSWTQA